MQCGFDAIDVLLVAFGGALGSALRYGATLLAARWFGVGFPYGTVFVNVTGSFLMGVVIELITHRFGASSELHLFLATGVLGGYTTFSSFSLDTALWERGSMGLAFAYVGSSILLGIAALFAGMALIRHLA